MRKKIPTITRPDTAYAATLRQDGGETPVGEEIGNADSYAPTADDVATMGRENQSEDQPAVDVPGKGAETARATADPPSVAVGSRLTRKIDIRVNALARQEDALSACGVDPAHVVRAALRRAVKGWQLAPGHVAPSEERRTRMTGWQARTSLAVDSGHLQALLRKQDPLDVLSKWALIRGQVEPRVWAEIDALLGEIAAFAAVPHESVDMQETDRKG